METQHQNKNKFGHWLKTSITARMLMVGFLIFILLIPLSYIKSLITERSLRKEAAINEINQQWGNEVLIYGPILEIPYKTYSEKTVLDKETQKTYTEIMEKIQYSYFFPEHLLINSNINPEEKSRGIYSTAVYNSSIKINGNFVKPNFKNLDIEQNDVLWDKVKLIVQSSNVKGVYGADIEFGDEKYPITSKYNETPNKNPHTLTLHTLETKHLEKNRFFGCGFHSFQNRVQY